MYPEAVVRAFAVDGVPKCRVNAERLDDALWLQIDVIEGEVPRLALGNALADLLQLSLRLRG